MQNTAIARFKRSRKKGREILQRTPLFHEASHFKNLGEDCQHKAIAACQDGDRLVATRRKIEC